MKARRLMICAGISALIATSGIASADPHTAQYKGTASCKMCHNGMHKAVVEGFSKVAHPKAMQKADADGAIVADFSANSAFTKDKVAYALGRGRTEQAYLDAEFHGLTGGLGRGREDLEAHCGG